MSEKRFSYVDLLEVEMIFDEENERGYYFNGENCTTDDVKALVGLLNEQQTTISKLKEENEQLRTQLLVCQQSKSDDGRIKVWQVPPIPKGMRITTSTTFNGEKDG